MSAPAGAISEVAGLAYAFQDAWASRFADAGKDIVVLADVALVLGDLGVPDARLAAMLLMLMQHVASGEIKITPGDGSRPQGSWNSRYVGR
jgi:hypothetical protein